jgi:predicted SprT family Zn-dependent metalloprotease
MKSRLGHYTLRGQEQCDPEIVISRRHIRRHGWDEAVQTLLHEMVHQWQDETGQKVDHGREFRRKARQVGIIPLARRHVAR